MVNINELKKEEENRKSLKKQCFNKILEFINNKIILVSRANSKRTWYEIPLFLLGHPTYEMDECSSYLIKKLSKNGFNVNFLNPNILLINW